MTKGSNFRLDTRNTHRIWGEMRRERGGQRINNNSIETQNIRVRNERGTTAESDIGGSFL